MEETADKSRTNSESEEAELKRKKHAELVKLEEEARQAKRKKELDEKNAASIKQIFEKKAYNVEISSEKISLSKNGPPPSSFEVYPDEVIAIHNINESETYKDMIEAAIQLFPDQKEFCLYASNEKEANKIKEIATNFKDFYFYVTTDLSQYERIKNGEEAMPRNSQKGQEKWKLKANPRHGKNLNKTLTQQGNWYSNEEVHGILLSLSCIEQDSWVNYAQLPVNRKMEEKKQYLHIFRDKIENFKKDLSEKTNDFLTMAQKAKIGEEHKTLVFYADVGGNHLATYAVNTRGEILVINSLPGYTYWDRAAEEAIKKALDEHKKTLGFEKISVHKIVPEGEGEKIYKQKTSDICGGITAIMSYAINPDKSFDDQLPDLQAHMEKVCGGNYAQIRKEHEALYQISVKDFPSKKEKEQAIQGVVDNSEYQLSPERIAVSSKHKFSM